MHNRKTDSRTQFRRTLLINERAEKAQKQQHQQQRMIGKVATQPTTTQQQQPSQLDYIGGIRKAISNVSASPLVLSDTKGDAVALNVTVDVVSTKIRDPLYVAIYPHKDYAHERAVYMPKRLKKTGTTELTVYLSRATCPRDLQFFVVLFEFTRDTFGDRVIYEKLGFAALAADKANRLSSGRKYAWNAEMCSNVDGSHVATIGVCMETAMLLSSSSRAGGQSLDSVFSGARMGNTLMPRPERMRIFQAYSQRVNDTLDRLLDATGRPREHAHVAHYPSRDVADMHMHDVFVNTRKLPIEMYFASNLFVKIPNVDVFVSQMVLLACIQTNLLPAEYRRRVEQQPSPDPAFMSTFLVDCIKAIPSLLTYASDTEGDNFNYPFQSGEFAYAQSDCEELTSTCLLCFHALAQSTCAIASELRAFAREFVFCAVLVTSKADGGEDTLHMTGALYPRALLQQMVSSESAGASTATTNLLPLVVDAMVNTDSDVFSKTNYDSESDVHVALGPKRNLAFMAAEGLYTSVLRLYTADVFLPDGHASRFVEYIPLSGPREGTRGPRMPGVDVMGFYHASKRCTLSPIVVDEHALAALKAELAENMYWTCFSALGERNRLTEAGVTALLHRLRRMASDAHRGGEIVRIIMCMRTAEIAETTEWAECMKQHNASMNNHVTFTDGSICDVMDNVVAYPYPLVRLPS